MTAAVYDGAAVIPRPPQRPHPPTHDFVASLRGSGGTAGWPHPNAAPTTAAVPRNDEPRAWRLAHESAVHGANAEIASSVRLRAMCAKESARCATSASANGRAVDEALRRRLRETRAMGARLREAEVRLGKELQQLIAARRQASALDGRLEKPLQKCLERVGLRSQRPEAEAIDDGATNAIDHHRAVLLQFRQQLAQAVARADALTLRGQQHLAAVRSDIVAKERAQEIDAQCLANPGFVGGGGGAAAPERGTAESNVVDDLPPPPLTMADDAGPPPPTPPSFPVRRAITQPDLWRQLSMRNVDTARAISNEACEHRMELAKLMKRVIDDQKGLAAAASTALASKMRQTASQAKSAAAELRLVESELRTLERQRDALGVRIREREQPLAAVKRRLDALRGRPARERIRDDVEAALEKEGEAVSKAVDSLRAKEKEIETEIAALARAKQRLLDQREAKVQNLALDQRCCELDGMSEYTFSSRRSSSASSARGASATLSKGVGKAAAAAVEAPLPVLPFLTAAPSPRQV